MRLQQPADLSDDEHAALDRALHLLGHSAALCAREVNQPVRDIAAAAGVNLGVITYYFGSEEALLNAALTEAFTRWTDRMARLTHTAGGDVMSSLRTAAGEMDRALAADRPLVVAFVEALAQAERNEKLRRQHADGYEELREHTAGLLSAGSDADRAVASLLIAIADGLMTQNLLDPQKAPTAEAAVEAIGGIFGGILKRR